MQQTASKRVSSLFLRKMTSVKTLHASQTVNMAGQEAVFVEKCFRSMNAEVNGFLIHNYSEINHLYMSSSGLSDIAHVLKNDLHLVHIQVHCDSELGTNVYKILGRVGTLQVSICLTSFCNLSTNSASTILVVRAKDTGEHMENFMPATYLITNAVSSINATHQLSAQITGYLPRKIVGREAASVISESLSSVSAKQVEGMKTHLLTSISAYSRKGPRCIFTNDQKMNLQVAVHYDDYNRQTNVIVGTPIILDSY